MTDEHKFEKIEEGKEISEEAQRGFKGFMAVGQDDFGLFACVLGTCPKCNVASQLVVTYNVHPNMTEDQRYHLPEGVETDTPSLIMRWSPTDDNPPHIGFTCGCYARFHRQVAHIKKGVDSRTAAAKRVATKKKAPGRKTRKKTK